MESKQASGTHTGQTLQTKQLGMHITIVLTFQTRMELMCRVAGNVGMQCASVFKLS